MTRLTQRLFNSALFAGLAAGLAALPAAAQQVTYYNFATPATANPQQYSYGCSAATPSSNPLFCFNYPASGTQNPVFVTDPGTSQWAVQMVHPQQSQDSSLWFSVPQKVQDGFNVWFQFRMTQSTTTPADGIAFVIQNSQGGGTDPTGLCTGTGSGPAALGGPGGCMGFGGIDNSVALEFDTFNNGGIFGEADGNHISLQTCGAGNVNTPDHSGNCQVAGSFVSNPTSGTTGNAVYLADGNLHDVVVVYNGPLETNPNTLSVYLDPTYTPSTHTPTSSPLFTIPFTVTQAVNLLNGGSAYVGFTAATGSYFQTTELTGWTFTPHTTVSQSQPLNPPGTPTTFNFGTHTYSTNFPTGTPTSGISMGVIANTISPANFQNLLIPAGPAQYTGSKCQVYDDTGGNCIIYSVYCYQTGSPSNLVKCPAPTNLPTDCSNPAASDCIDLQSAYNNSIQPVSPGYLQGDALYSPITSISGDGTTDTVNCTGECAVTANQSVTILHSDDTVWFSGTVQSLNGLNQFTISGPVSGTDTTGGFITSTNVQDIFISYTPQNLDGTTAGHTTNFSDFVVTSTTVVNTQTSLASSGTAIDNQALDVTATVAPSGPAGLTLISAQGLGNPPLPGSTMGGMVSFSDNSGPIAACQNVALINPVTVNNVTSYQAPCTFTPALPGSDTVTATYSGDAYHNGSTSSQAFNIEQLSINPPSIDFGTLYLGDVAIKPVTITNVGTTAASISDPLVAILPGSNGNLSEFVTLNLCPKTLAAGASCTMYVGFFAGPFYNQQTATLTVNTNAPSGPETVSLTALVINPQARLSALFVPFGLVALNTSSTRSITLTSGGGTPLSGIGISLSGDTADFSVASGCPASLPVGQSCTLQVTFKPGTKGLHTADLVVTDNARNSPQHVALTGRGN